MSIREIIGKTFLKVFKSSSERYVKKRVEFIAQVNALEPQYAQLTDAELKDKTAQFRGRIGQLEDQIIGGNLRRKLRDLQLMPEEARRPAKKHLTDQLRQCCQDVIADAFAAIREAADRQLGVRNVFTKQYEFDPSILSPEMKAIFDQVGQQITDGEDVHKIELPPAFYAEVRKHFRAEDRPPFRFRHFDVQLIGGNALYEGNISEMATGEGKTLVATLAAYIVALSGRKVHIVTVNDYLAQRDRDWMGPVYEALGLTVGAIQSDMDTRTGEERRAQYHCDITHGTNNEFGFDFLRDNMKVALEDQAQGPLDFVIIDEVDSILIDEARTPLIISGPAADDVSRYKNADAIARQLIQAQREYSNIQAGIDKLKRQIAGAEGELSDAKKAKEAQKQAEIERQIEQCQEKLAQQEDLLQRTTQYYEVEYDRRSVHLTHEGVGRAQELAGVGSFFVGQNMEWPHLMEQSLRAHILYHRDQHYVVQNGEVIIVDEFTGRLMAGRRWSDGLHQAVEAKENVTVKEETQTLATITIQNFFKLYQQLAGMTGTAMTEADEFMKIYQLFVVTIPTNKPVIRDDMNDMIYKSMPEKFNAIVEEIHNVSQTGRPLLIGTISIEKNEALSAALTRKYGLDHEVLNAKQHAREAAIIAKAGQQHQRRDGATWGNITIATNMAGRGTDIKLLPEVLWDVECSPHSEKSGKHRYQLTNRGTKKSITVDSDDPQANIWGLYPDMKLAGGLHVLGTERHEARRIDNQLRGRSGRQGDPGSSQFFLSFDDDLMRIFNPDWAVKAMKWFGWEEGQPIYHTSISKMIEKTQKKVEERNFESRKSLLDYDEVMDYQRQVFYTRRQSIIEGRGLERIIWDMIEDIVAETTGKMLSKDYPFECIIEWARTAFGVDLDLERIRGSEADEIESMIRDRARNNADQEINVTLGEYMGSDLEEAEWDFKGLTKWAMSRFSVNLSQNQLRKMTPDDVEEQLAAAAHERIEKFDCSRLAAFLEPEFAKRILCDWVNQKFALKIDADQLIAEKPDLARQYILDQAHAAYRQREIEYPIDFILNAALRHEQTGSGFAAKEICDWANAKYRANLQLEEVQRMSYDQLRNTLLDLSKSWLTDRLDQQIDQTLQQYPPSGDTRNQLATWANDRFYLQLQPNELDDQNAKNLITERGRQFLRSELTELEKYVLLQIYDATWKDHLYAMDHLKSGIGLRGFAERDPKIEYKREGYRMFQMMLSTIRDKVTDIIFKAHLESGQTLRSIWNVSQSMHAEYNSFADQQQAAQVPQGEAAAPKTIKLDKPKVGRNDLCPCGSGKKYKKCCGKNE